MLARDYAKCGFAGHDMTEAEARAMLARYA